LYFMGFIIITEEEDLKRKVYIDKNVYRYR